MAQALHGTVEGDPDVVVTSFSKIETGKPGQLCFYANPKYEQYVYTSKASVLLVNNDFVPREAVTPTLVRVENAYTALADLLKWVAAQKKAYRRHRGRCRIACSAKIGRKVWVGDFVTIGRKVRIGERTKIFNNVTIGEGTVIGRDCIIYPGVHVFPGMVIGDRVILHAGCIIGDDGFGNAKQPDGSWEKIEHLGNVVIGNDVEIGSNTTIDKAPMETTIIEDGVRIDNPERLHQISDLKTQNPALKVQLSIGGWGSGRFSEMAADPKLRKSFAKDCARVMKEFNLDGIAPAPRGIPQVEVTFNIDANGILNVSATDKATGKAQNIRIEASSGLSDDEIQRMRDEAKANEAADKEAKERVEKINNADAMVFQTEKNLKEYGDKIPAEKKSAIEAANQNLKKAVDEKNLADIDKYNAELEAAWHAASEDMAKAAQAGQAGPQGPQPDYGTDNQGPDQQ